MMTEDGWRISALARLTALEAGQKIMSDKVAELEKQGAVDEVHRTNVEGRLTKIEAVLNRLVWLIITSLLLAVMSYFIQGGFAGG